MIPTTSVETHGTSELREEVLIPARPRAQAEPRAKRMWPRVFKWIRRTHLYLGVALLPWVFLYGATAVLFNHSDWFNDARKQELGIVEAGPGAILGLPDPDLVAAAVFERLREKDGDDLQMLAGSTEWLGSLQFNATSESEKAFVALHPEGRGGYARMTPADDDLEDAPGWRKVESLDDYRPLERDARDTVAEAGSELLSAQGLTFESLRVRRFPETRFRFTDGVDEYVCDVGMDGQIEIVPVEELSTLRTRLLRLHIAHGDPGYGGARRNWAFIVDVMGFAMLIWGISGVVMWWMIRPTRTLGLVALVSGVGAMAVLAGMLWHASGSI